jgi:hypothetical protein
METVKRMGVSVTALPDTPEQTARAAEVLARAITGLAFEGIGVSLNIHEFDDEDERDS